MVDPNQGRTGLKRLLQISLGMDLHQGLKPDLPGVVNQLLQQSRRKQRGDQEDGVRPHPPALLDLIRVHNKIFAQKRKVAFLPGEL